MKTDFGLPIRSPACGGFLCHTHYDDVRSSSYADGAALSARLHLHRLRGQPQFISTEGSAEETRHYLRAIPAVLPSLWRTHISGITRYLSAAGLRAAGNFVPWFFVVLNSRGS
jgi:hypothetical protein